MKNIPDNSTKILENVVNYIQELPDAYKALHPGKGGHLSSMIQFVDAFMMAYNDKTTTSPEEKLAKMFLFIEQEVQKQMALDGGKKNLNEFIDYLNKEPSNHHQARLITMLYQDLKNKINYTPEQQSLKTDGNKNVEDGKKSMHAAAMHTFFKIGAKTPATNDPYKTIREMLNPPQVLQKSLVS